MNQPKALEKAPAPKQTVNQLVLSQRAQIQMALPKHMSPDRMLRIAMTEIRKNPELGVCDPMSFLGAIIQASQLGLEPGSALGHAFLVPFNNKKKGVKEVQLITGFKGFIELARRSGQVSSLSARLVHEKDTFKFEYGDDEKITHVPTSEAAHGPITWCYAIARFKDGGVQREVMSRAQLEEHKGRYSKGNPVWDTDFDEMCRKTLIRRIAKYLPLSPELVRAIELDDTSSVGEGQANWSVLDASYEPAAQQLDAAKVSEAQNTAEPGDVHNTPAAKAAERKISLDLFEKTVKAARSSKIDVEKVIGCKINEVMLAPNVEFVYGKVDLLTIALEDLPK